MPSASTPEEKQAKVAAFHAARALRVERARNEVAAWNDAAIYKPEWEDAKRILSDAFEADWRTALRGHALRPKPAASRRLSLGSFRLTSSCSHPRKTRQPRARRVRVTRRSRGERRGGALVRGRAQFGGRGWAQGESRRLRPTGA